MTNVVFWKKNTLSSKREFFRSARIDWMSSNGNRSGRFSNNKICLLNKREFKTNSKNKNSKDKKNKWKKKCWNRRKNNFSNLKNWSRRRLRLRRFILNKCRLSERRRSLKINLISLLLKTSFNSNTWMSHRWLCLRKNNFKFKTNKMPLMNLIRFSKG